MLLWKCPLLRASHVLRRASCQHHYIVTALEEETTNMKVGVKCLGVTTFSIPVLQHRMKMSISGMAHDGRRQEPRSAC